MCSHLFTELLHLLLRYSLLIVSLIPVKIILQKTHLGSVLSFFIHHFSPYDIKYTSDLHYKEIREDYHCCFTEVKQSSLCFMSLIPCVFQNPKLLQGHQDGWPATTKLALSLSTSINWHRNVGSLKYTAPSLSNINELHNKLHTHLKSH